MDPTKERLTLCDPDEAIDRQDLGGDGVTIHILLEILLKEYLPIINCY